jgi:hypothetical protein
MVNGKPNAVRAAVERFRDLRTWQERKMPELAARPQLARSAEKPTCGGSIAAQLPSA